MITKKRKSTTEKEARALQDRMQSAGTGTFVEETTTNEFEEEETSLPGQLLPGDGLRLSNLPDDIPQLIASLRKMRGMTQAELGTAIGYPSPVIGNIEQGRRKLGLKTLNDLFNALGGELYIEYREKPEK